MALNATAMNTTVVPLQFNTTVSPIDKTTESPSALTQTETGSSTLSKFAEPRSARTKVLSQSQAGDIQERGFINQFTSVLGDVKSQQNSFIAGLTSKAGAEQSSFLAGASSIAVPTPSISIPAITSGSMQTSIRSALATSTASSGSILPTGGGNALSPNTGTMALGLMIALFIKNKLFG